MEFAELSYDSLRSLLLQERSQTILEPVSEDFFEKFDSYLQIQEKILRESFSIEQARVVDNSKKVFSEIKQMRLRKILFKALKDFESNAINSSGLTGQEKEFYRNTVSLLNAYNKKSDEPLLVRLKILVDLPKIQTPSAGVIGPFSAGQVVGMEMNTAQMLIERKAAEKT